MDDKLLEKIANILENFFGDEYDEMEDEVESILEKLEEDRMDDLTQSQLFVLYDAIGTHGVEGDTEAIYKEARKRWEIGAKASSP